MKNEMKKEFINIFALMCIILLTIAGSSCTNPKDNKNKIFTVGITQIATNPGIDAIRQGFLEEMKKLGYEEGVNINYYQTNANGDMAVAQSIAQKYVSDKCDLIFPITTPSSQACAKAIKGTDIPLVFGAVTDPVAAGLVDSLESPGGNISGTSDKWPVAEQFGLLLQLVPNVKKIGVIYNPGETNSEANIKEVEKVCYTRNLALVKVPVSNTNEVYAAAQSLVGRCDAFYIPADNTVITAMEAVVKVSEQNKIPLLPGVSSNIKQGGFGTIGPDYYDIGVESAKIADKVLKGKKAGDIPVATAKRFEYFFNKRSAEATGVNIPSELFEQEVAKVFK
ncbi:MAG: ABC transporter substrate-binding protein [Candidatus Brocadiales bacterium]|nr:ABC transporter substrate-binding protein [Candidatus Brocadiales bacterium]